MRDVAVAVIAWVLGLTIVAGEVTVLVIVVRGVLRRSTGRPARRAAYLLALAGALVVLWAVSTVFP